MIKNGTTVKSAPAKRIVAYLMILLLALTIFAVSGRQVVVLLNRCVGCGDCVRACNRDAVTMVMGKACIDPEKCTGCGVCLSACAYHALRYKGEQ